MFRNCTTHNFQDSKQVNLSLCCIQFSKTYCLSFSRTFSVTSFVNYDLLLNPTHYSSFRYIQYNNYCDYQTSPSKLYGPPVGRSWPALALIMSVLLQCIITFGVFYVLAYCDQGRNKGWSSRVAARGANFRGAKTSLEYSHASHNDGDTF
jgi:hypothetical protein